MCPPRPLLWAQSEGHSGHHLGIAHTRWATHGGKTDENAHPHSDMGGRIALVHNGPAARSNAWRIVMAAVTAGCRARLGAD